MLLLSNKFMNESYCSFMEIHVLTLNKLYYLIIIQVCILFYIPPPVGEEIIKGFRDEGVMQGGKREKKIWRK